MKYLIIILLTLISNFSAAQYIADTSIANNLLLLEIGFWKAESDAAKLTALLNKAAIYKTMNRHEQGIIELERVQKYTADQQIAALISYEKMLHYFLSDNYNYASHIFISSAALQQIGKKKEYDLMRLEALNGMENWRKCKEELLAMCSVSDSIKRTSIEQLPTAYSYIIPEYCARLSSFIPGLGEIKAGYPVKGITSFLIHAGLIIFTGYNFYTGFYVTGAISGVLPFLKFYGGGKRLSQNLAEERNEEEAKNLKKKYTAIIEEAVSH